MGVVMQVSLSELWQESKSLLHLLQERQIMFRVPWVTDKGKYHTSAILQQDLWNSAAARPGHYTATDLWEGRQKEHVTQSQDSAVLGSGVSGSSWVFCPSDSKERSSIIQASLCQWWDQQSNGRSQSANELKVTLKLLNSLTSASMRQRLTSSSACRWGQGEQRLQSAIQLSNRSLQGRTSVRLSTLSM